MHRSLASLTRILFPLLLIPGLSHAAVQGYASVTSASPGDSVDVCVSSTAATLDLLVVRMGAVNETLQVFPGLPAPNLATPDSSWFKGCNWPVWRRLGIPTGWRSGLYDLILRPGTGAPGHVFLVVRSGTVTSPILFVSAVNTSQAYNAFGGKSLYDYNSGTGGRAPRVTFNRPYEGGNGLGQVPKYELGFVRWMERSGIQVDYVTDVDLATRPSILAGHRLLLMVGHNEYWTASMFDAAQAFVDSSGNLAIFGGNTCFFQARYENQARTLVCYKSYADPKKAAHPESTTVKWRDPVVNRVEAGLLGVLTPDCEATVSMPINLTYVNLWPTEGVESSIYQSLGTNVLGYEFDIQFSGYSPPYMFHLLQTYVPGPCPQVASAIYYERQPAYAFALSGGAVFNAGTVQWSWGLDVNSGGVPDTRMQRISSNLLDRMVSRMETRDSASVVIRAIAPGVVPAPGTGIAVRASSTGFDTTVVGTTLMHDDGIGADTTAGDGTFTGVLELPPGTRLPLHLSYLVAGNPLVIRVGSPYLWWREDGSSIQSRTPDSLQACPCAGSVPAVSRGTTSLRAAPNPARVWQELRWEGLVEPGVLSVHDVQGRRIRDWRVREAAGTVRWDGTDERGQVVGAGVYWAILHGRSTQSVHRLVRVN